MSEDTTIEKEHKKEEIRRISTSEIEKCKYLAKLPYHHSITALFRLCLKEAAPFDHSQTVSSQRIFTSSACIFRISITAFSFTASAESVTERTTGATSVTA